MQPTQTLEESYGLYANMARVSRCQQLILTKCIMLIGLTRVGKSTVWNWLMGYLLKGSNRPGQAIYIPGDAHQNYANMDPQANSVTLIPSVGIMGDSICAVDPAGFEDNRNYVGAFIVSEQIKILFQKIKQVKFIIVIKESQIDQKQFLITLKNFVRLFNYRQISTEVKQNLLQSAALLVTKAEYPDNDHDAEFLERLRGLIIDWSAQNYIFDYKVECIQVLNAIIQHNRIDFFRKARRNTPAPQAQALKNFNQKGWNFFNLAENVTNNPSLLQNNFVQIYDNFLPSDRASFDLDIRKKTTSYQQVAQIFRDVLTIAFDRFYQTQISCPQVFQRIQNFLFTHDTYTQENKEIQYRSRFTSIAVRKGPQQVVTVVKKMNNIILVIQELMKFNIFAHQTTIPFRQRCQFFKEKLRKVLLILKSFICSDSLQEQRFIDFSFVILKGVDELSFCG